ncbi:DUF4384 domain-containing protein, partial [Falsiroseomonas sp. CW058]|uniref:DUF4384 domain-containing protein n=1 Tax=Falsiroseomonas sp. CW058 TaxID=3388664 RepID=UPI003D3184B8
AGPPPVPAPAPVIQAAPAVPSSQPDLPPAVPGAAPSGVAAPAVLPPAPVAPSGPAAPPPVIAAPAVPPAPPAAGSSVPPGLGVLTPVVPGPVSGPPAPPVAPPAPPVQVAVPNPRIDFRAAAMAAASAAPCSLLDGTGGEGTLSVAGVLRRGGEAQVMRALADRNIPAQAATLRLTPFDGPYCGALDTIRQVAARPEEAPRVSIVGTLPLQRGDLLRLDVELPDRPGHLYVSYLMKSGEIAHLVPSHTQPAGARVRLGEPRQGFPGWEVDEPFGTDMIIVFASERPLFAQPRPVIEPLDNYVAALAAALRSAREAGVRVSARAVVVETVARR